MLLRAKDPNGSLGANSAKRRNLAGRLGRWVITKVFVISLLKEGGKLEGPGEEESSLEWA